MWKDIVAPDWSW